MSETLKPCPFCGGVAVSAEGGNVYVTCAGCLAEMGPGETDTRAEAIEKWNRRAPLSPEIRAAFGTALEVMANRARRYDQQGLPDAADRIRTDAAALRSFLSVSTEGLK